MKYTLTCQEGNFKNTVEFTEDFLPSVLENMQLFLRGCGFYFDGTLDIINEETEELYSEQAQWNDTVAVTSLNHMDMYDSTDVEHAPNYFDTTRNR
jgi:hypothetical protein